MLRIAFENMPFLHQEGRLQRARRGMLSDEEGRFLALSSAFR